MVDQLTRELQKLAFIWSQKVEEKTMGKNTRSLYSVSTSFTNSYFFSIYFHTQYTQYTGLKNAGFEAWANLKEVAMMDGVYYSLTIMGIKTNFSLREQ